MGRFRIGFGLCCLVVWGLGVLPGGLGCGGAASILQDALSDTANEAADETSSDIATSTKRSIKGTLSLQAVADLSKSLATESCPDGITGVRRTYIDTDKAKVYPVNEDGTFSFVVNLGKDLQLDIMCGETAVATLIPVIANRQSSVWSPEYGETPLQIGTVTVDADHKMATVTNDLWTQFDTDQDETSDAKDDDIDGDGVANTGDTTPFGGIVSGILARTCQGRGMHDINANGICDEWEPDFSDSLIANRYANGSAAVAAQLATPMLVDAFALSTAALGGGFVNTSIDADDTILFLFNQVLDCATVNQETVIVLAGGSLVPATIVPMAMAHTGCDAILFRGPVGTGANQGSWPTGSTLMIAFTQGVKNSAGIPLQFPVLQEIPIKSTASDQSVSVGNKTLVTLSGLTEPDADGDTIGDNLDNCPSVYNPGQGDGDDDGIGDICDSSPGDDSIITIDHATTSRSGLLASCNSETWKDGDADGLCDAIDPCPASLVRACGTSTGWTHVNFGLSAAASSSNLEVVAKSPPDGSSRIPVNSRFCASFNLPINPDTIDTSSFNVFGISGTVTFDPNRNMACFQPANPLSLNTTYTATLTKTVTSTSGKKFAAAVSWSATTPPILAADSVAPAAGTTQVATCAKPAFTFNNSLKVDTLTAQTITLTGGIKCTVAYDSKTKTATCTPDRSLDANTQYIATVTTAVKDTNGSSLASFSTTSFTTGIGCDLTTPTFGGIDLAASTASTSSTLTWTAATDDTAAPTELVYLIYMAKTAKAIDFKTPTATTAAGATSYAVTGITANTTFCFGVRAKDPTGNIDTNTKTVCAKTLIPAPANVTPLSATGKHILKWDAVTGATGYRIYTAPYSSTTGKGAYETTPISVASGVTSYTRTGLADGTTIYYRIAAVDSAGDEGNKSEEVYVIASPGWISDEDSHGEPGVYNGSAGIGISNILTATSGNDLIVAWTQSEGASITYPVKKLSGGVWTTLQSPSTQIIDLAADAAGNIYSAYRETPPGPTSKQLARIQQYSAATGSWDAIDGGSLNLDIAVAGDSPKIAVDSSGVVYAGWLDNTMYGGRYQILVKKYENGVWSSVGSGPLNDNALGSMGDIAIDRNDVPYVAWVESVTAGNTIHIKRFTGGAWNAVGTALSGAIPPTLHFDAANNLYVFYSGTTITKIDTTTNVVSTFLGTATSSDFPNGITVFTTDAAGRIFGQSGSYPLKQYDPVGGSWNNVIGYTGPLAVSNSVLPMQSSGWGVLAETADGVLHEAFIKNIGSELLPIYRFTVYHLE